MTTVRKKHSHGEPPLAADQRIARCLRDTFEAFTPDRAITVESIALATGLSPDTVIAQVCDFATSTFAIVPVECRLLVTSKTKFYAEFNPDQIREAARRARSAGTRLLDQASTFFATAQLIESAQGERRGGRGKATDVKRRKPRRSARCRPRVTEKKKVGRERFGEDGRLEEHLSVT